MSRNRSRRPSGRVTKARHPSSNPATEGNGDRSPVRSAGFVIGALCLLIIGAFALIRFRPGHSEGPPMRYTPRATGTLTFAKDIAPIVFQHCAPCHRPDQPAPFSLLAFADVKKRAQQIAEVTTKRVMPPWPPEPDHGTFLHERRLSLDEIGVIEQWVKEGASEGNPADLPPSPVFPEGWQLGAPDLVVPMPRLYTLPADGKDIYRNFVFPIPVESTRYVKGVEFRPGNSKVIHHAFINVDETRQSRRLAAADAANPGFEGMELPESAVMPGGQLLGWQPGKVPSFSAPGLSWVLKPNTDLVLQLHMQPSGKPEMIQPSVAFYFTNEAPTNIAFRLKLTRYDFDIPAGATNYLVEQSYVLPVDVSLLRVLPHAHYLGKDLQGYAMLPNGEKRWLLRIKDWDPNWQGDYTYARPVFLPKGARLVMQYGYDNSTNNPRNPNRPPQLVRQGLQSTDEMAGLVFQALTSGASDRALLAKDYFAHMTRVSAEYFRYRLRLNPDDAEAHTRLGRVLSAEGEVRQATAHLLAAIRLKPEDDRAHYELGYLHLRQNRLIEAFEAFQTVTRLNPDDHQAFGNLGYICMKQGRLAEAQQHFETALRLNPDDEIARRNLSSLRNRQ